MNKDQFLCPNDGTPMRRDLRPVTLTYKGENLTFDLAGWYCEMWESVHVGRTSRT